MSPKFYTYQFARISIIMPHPLDKIEFFDSVFKQSKTISDRYNKYLFLNVNLETYMNHAFFSGRLVKYSSRDEEIVNENTRDFDISTINDAVVSKPEFILHPKTGIIAFRPIPSKFSSNQFQQKFARLVENAFDQFFISAKIETINEDFKIQDQFNRFRKIDNIIVNIHPSNPNNRDFWEKVDNELKEIEASNFEQKITGGPNGLNKDRLQETDIYKGMLMAADGYGFAAIEGIHEDGRRLTITTADNPTETKATPVEDPKDFLSQFYDTFKRVWDRNKNEPKE